MFNSKTFENVIFSKEVAEDCEYLEEILKELQN